MRRKNKEGKGKGNQPNGHNVTCAKSVQRARPPLTLAVTRAGVCMEIEIDREEMDENHHCWKVSKITKFIITTNEQMPRMEGR